MYQEKDIAYETHDFWVLNVGKKGFEVMRKGITHSTKVAAIGNGPGPNLGVERAIAECERRQSEFDASVIKPCCANERRSMRGGCLNCGDPCL